MVPHRVRLRLICLLLPVTVLAVSAASAQPVTVMSFNAENLFDTDDDLENPGENSYLPLALKDKRRALHDIACDAYYDGYPSFLDQCKSLDWNDEVYAKKLERLADVIKALTPRPDVVVMQEVENKRVLDDLVGRHLAGDGYRVIQLDTSEKVYNRGIDVGILTRLELAGNPTAHRVYFGGDGKFCGGAVREILAVPIELPDGETLHIFGVHLTPGDKRLICRIHALKRLNELAATLPSDSLAMAAGDFNIGCNEAVTETVTELFAEGGWFTSPIIRHGCSIPGSFRSYASPSATPDAWSFLDLILVSAALNPAMPTSKNWFADLGSFATVIVHPEQVGVDNEDQGYVVPQPFDPGNRPRCQRSFPGNYAADDATQLIQNATIRNPPTAPSSHGRAVNAFGKSGSQAHVRRDDERPFLPGRQSQRLRTTPDGLCSGGCPKNTRLSLASQSMPQRAQSKST